MYVWRHSKLFTNWHVSWDTLYLHTYLLKERHCDLARLYLVQKNVLYTGQWVARLDSTTQYIYSTCCIPARIMQFLEWCKGTDLSPQTLITKLDVEYLCMHSFQSQYSQSLKIQRFTVSCIRLQRYLWLSGTSKLFLFPFLLQTPHNI